MSSPNREWRGSCGNYLRKLLEVTDGNLGAHLCDRIAILDHGRIVALDTPDALIRGLGAEQRVVFSLDENLSPVLQKALMNLGQVEFAEGQLTIRRKDGCE